MCIKKYHSTSAVNFFCVGEATVTCHGSIELRSMHFAADPAIQPASMATEAVLIWCTDWICVNLENRATSRYIALA